ncbi:MAG TPA: hypothetical protein VG411_17190, partial [Actinomycetota bacterium]|nr:hypothetical protein [Actinomycetota bacterium]
MTVDTRGRRAAQALVEAVERLGPVPDLDRLRRRRRRRVTTRAGLAVAAGIVAVALVGQTLPSPERLAGDPERPAGVPGLDGRVSRSVDVGRADGSELAAGTSGLGLISHRNDRGAALVRGDPGTDRVVARIAFGHSNSDPAVADDGSLYAVRPRGGSRPDRPELVRVDPLTNRIAATIALPPASPPYGATALVAAADAGWAAYPGGGLVRVDP